METLTPMLKQYQQIKSRYPDYIIFFRLGDFYEMFYEDAKKAAPVLEVVLTSRGAGKAGKIPMCGIPFHAADNYIAKLIKRGFKIAICEQTEDPSKTKGLVKREVTRLITSGTFIDENSEITRIIACISISKETHGISFVDIKEGTIYTNQYSHEIEIIEKLAKLSVYECIYPSSEEAKIKSLFHHPLLRLKKISLSSQEDWIFNYEIARKSICEHFNIHNLRGFGIENMRVSTSCCGALLEYLKEVNQTPLKHIDRISLIQDDKYMYISPPACYGLEINSLIKTLDHTLTPMGRRRLRHWVYNPLKNVTDILQRQEAVSILKDNPNIQEGLKNLLRRIPDIEKSLSRISCGYTSARELVSLRNALSVIPDIKKLIHTLEEKNPLFHIEDPGQLRILLEEAINPDVPLSHSAGKIIRTGYNEKLDSLRELQENNQQWLAKLQKEEIERTKINSLKIGYNKVFGYYIEVTKPNIALVPADYIRKQTLVNAERFTTPKLKEFEEKILTAEEEILKLEQELIRELEQQILQYTTPLHELSKDIGRVDIIYSLSIVAARAGYSAPSIDESYTIQIQEGRHPLVEQTTSEPFIPNDTLLDCENNHLLIITGPNMAGKSTYIRQVAILVIMAQMGSFIPARKAHIGIVDKVFTRIGAHDEITRGQSTFMVEMSETAEIMNNISQRSLVILDEIGRGTSTYDGLSLAWAIAEHLSKTKVRTLFATHFHELTGLAEKYSGVKNYNVAVKEWGEEIIFLHKIVPGGTDESYGIYVAKLAGIHPEVIKRARQILTHLELHGKIKDKLSENAPPQQLSLFNNEDKTAIKEIEKELINLDINSLTPLEALNIINIWKEKIKNNG